MFSTWHGLWDFKDLAKRTAPDKVLRDKLFNIAKNPKYDRCHRGLASMVYKFFDKITKGSGIKIEVIQNQQLGEEVHKPVIRKLKKGEFIHHLKIISGVLI